jgi:hypothetical protein
MSSWCGAREGGGGVQCACWPATVLVRTTCWLAGVRCCSSGVSSHGCHVLLTDNRYQQQTGYTHLGWGGRLPSKSPTMPSAAAAAPDSSKLATGSAGSEALCTMPPAGRPPLPCSALSPVAAVPVAAAAAACRRAVRRRAARGPRAFCTSPPCGPKSNCTRRPSGVRNTVM